MNIALFLDDVTAANGPLMFLPGSHKDGTFEAGHDLETTSYPLWTLSRDKVTELAEQGLCRPHRIRRLGSDFPLRSRACEPAEHQPVWPDDRLFEPVSRRQPHPPLQAEGVDRASGLHGD